MSSRPSGRRPSTLAADRFRAASRPLGAPVDLKPRVPHQIPKETVPVMAAASRKTWKEVHAENTRGSTMRSPVAMGTARLNDPWAAVTGPRAGKPEAPRVVASGIDLPSASASARSESPLAVGTAAKKKAVRKSKAKTRVKAARAQAKATTRSRSERLLVSSLVAAFGLVSVAVASLTVTGNMRNERSRVAVVSTLQKVHERQSTFRVINHRFASLSELEAMGLKVPDGQRVVRSNATISHWFMAVRDENTGVTCSRTGELFDDSGTEREPSCTSVVR